VQFPVIGFFVEPNQERFAFSHRWSPQVSGRAEHVSCQCVVVRRILSHVEGDNLFAAGDDDLLSCAG
jgi:hypothetical protein